MYLQTNTVFLSFKTQAMRVLISVVATQPVRVGIWDFMYAVFPRSRGRGPQQRRRRQGDSQRLLRFKLRGLKTAAVRDPGAPCKWTKVLNKNQAILWDVPFVLLAPSQCNKWKGACVVCQVKGAFVVSKQTKHCCPRGIAASVALRSVFHYRWVPLNQNMYGIRNHTEITLLSPQC